MDLSHSKYAGIMVAILGTLWISDLVTGIIDNWTVKYSF